MEATPTPAPTQEPPKSFRPNLEKVDLPKSQLKSGAIIRVRYNVSLPEGYHINEEAPSDLVLTLNGDTKSAVKFQLKKLSTEAELLLPTGITSGIVQASSTLYYCRVDKTGICEIKSFEYTLPFELGDGGEEAVIDAHYLPGPKSS